MSGNADLNDVPYNFELKLDAMRKILIEYHEYHSCKYEILTNWRITSTGKPVNMLIRVCKCGRQNDKSLMLSRKSIDVNEMYDGVEFHLSSYCKFTTIRSPNGTFKITKHCECPGRLQDRR